MALQQPRAPRRWLSRPEESAPPAHALWPGYTVSPDEQRRLDMLIGKALLDPTFCERLLSQRDVVPLAEFGLSATTEEWLRSIKASSLTEFAQAITYG